MMKYYEQYKILHERKKYGISGDRLVNNIIPHIPVGTKSILDYGAGQSNTATLLGRAMGIPDTKAFDPCVTGREVKPDRKFDFVICTDVMEHVPEEEINEVLTDIWGYAEKGALFVISNAPAAATLPNGENAHCTVKPKEWWEKRLRDVFETVTPLPNFTTNVDWCAFFVKPSVDPASL